MKKTADRHPTGPFTIQEPEDQEIFELYVARKRRETDFEALKIVKGSVGQTQKKKSVAAPAVRCA